MAFLACFSVFAENIRINTSGVYSFMSRSPSHSTSSIETFSFPIAMDSRSFIADLRSPVRIAMVTSTSSSTCTSTISVMVCSLSSISAKGMGLNSISRHLFRRGLNLSSTFSEMVVAIRITGLRVSLMMFAIAVIPPRSCLPLTPSISSKRIIRRFPNTVTVCSAVRLKSSSKRFLVR